MNYFFRSKDASADKPDDDSKMQQFLSSDKDAWKKHDTLRPGVSSNRIVTRSQTGFNRVENTKENLQLFADPERHTIPGQPHLMEVMKGQFGSIPRTIVTRSTGQHLKKSEELEAKLNQFKNYHPPLGNEEVEQEDVEIKQEPEPEE